MKITKNILCVVLVLPMIIVGMEFDKAPLHKDEEKILAYNIASMVIVESSKGSSRPESFNFECYKKRITIPFLVCQEMFPNDEYHDFVKQYCQRSIKDLLLDIIDDVPIDRTLQYYLNDSYEMFDRLTRREVDFEHLQGKVEEMLNDHQKDYFHTHYNLNQSWTAPKLWIASRAAILEKFREIKFKTNTELCAECGDKVNPWGPGVCMGAGGTQMATGNPACGCIFCLIGGIFCISLNNPCLPQTALHCSKPCEDKNYARDQQLSVAITDLWKKL